MKTKYTKEFKIDPWHIKFPLDDDLEKYVEFNRPTAFPLMVLKNKCEKLLTIGHDAKLGILGFQLKDEPNSIHWVWPVDEELFDSLMKYNVKTFENFFINKFLKEHPLIHVAESVFIYPDDSHLIHKTTTCHR